MQQQLDWLGNYNVFPGDVLDGFSRRRAKLISGAAGNVGLELRGSRIVDPRRSISVDNSFRKQIVHTLARIGTVCGKQVVERAVFTHDDNQCLIGVAVLVSPLGAVLASPLRALLVCPAVELKLAANKTAEIDSRITERATGAPKPY